MVNAAQKIHCNARICEVAKSCVPACCDRSHSAAPGLTAIFDSEQNFVQGNIALSYIVHAVGAAHSSFD